MTLVTPHAPCRVKLVLTEGTLTRLDRATLRAVLAHDLAHLQLGHPEARQQREEERKQTEKQVGVGHRRGRRRPRSFIPGVGGLVGKGIGTAKKAATAAMEAHGNPYLPEEERAADALTVTYLSQAEPCGCAFATVLRERLRSSSEDAWTLWVHQHPVSAERVAALAEPCPEGAAGS